MPRIDELRAQPAANGSFEINARVADSNLDPNSWKFEWQPDAAGAWQPMVLQGATVQPIGNTGLPLGGSALHAFWQPPAGVRPAAIRGTVADRAGNSATYAARLDGGLGGSGVSGPMLTLPGATIPTAGVPNVPAQQAFTRPAANPLQASNAAQGWQSVGTSASPATQSGSTPSSAQPTTPATQPWPAANSDRAPIQLWTSGAAPKDDGVTAYGSPQLFSAPPQNVARTEPAPEQPRVEAHYAGISKPQVETPNTTPPPIPSSPQFASLEPYREPSQVQSTAPAPAAPALTSPVGPAFATPVPATPAPIPSAAPPAPTTRAIVRDVTPIGSSVSPNTPPTPPKLVGSRTFALEYDLDEAGRGGVSKVELWGSRDGGKSWNRYAQDDDNRSPLVVTVDEEGLYGFRIVVQNAGSTIAETPRPGDSPELWVSVDLKRPVVELTAIERGQGNVSDHLILRWRAMDNNLEPRPIGLFYSSRPAGPWSAIATNLENTGEYAWRVERYVPARFYLRVEARDTAGNLAAFQTRDPVEFSPPNLAGRLRSAEPVGPANGANGSFR
jgi:hypothetical protein